MILANRSFVKCGTFVFLKCVFVKKELVILSYAIVCFHPSVSLNNEKSYYEISKDKIAVFEKTAGLWSENFSDLNSACHKVLVSVKKLLSQGMLNESVQT